MGGGNDAISDSLMSEYDSASSNGNATMIEPTTRRAYFATVPSFIDSLSLVMHSALDETELDQREAHHQEQKDDCLRAGEAELKGLKSILINAVDQNTCGIDRAAARHDIDLRERLQHRDGIDDEKEEQRR